MVVIRSGPNLIGAGCSEIKRARELHLRVTEVAGSNLQDAHKTVHPCVCVCTRQPRIIHAHHHSHTTRPHAVYSAPDAGIESRAACESGALCAATCVRERCAWSARAVEALAHRGERHSQRQEPRPLPRGEGTRHVWLVAAFGPVPIVRCDDTC